MRRYLIALTLSAVGWALTPPAAEAQRVARRGGGFAAAGPAGGAAVGSRHTAVASGPFGAAGGTRRSGSVVTPGGSTVQVLNTVLIPKRTRSG